MDKILIFIFGTIIGSFLNVCIYRLPKNISIVVPPSACPKCKKSILWYDNIPVLSYILLGGRCRFCKERISFRYVLVEVLTAALILLLYLVFGMSPKFLAYSVLTCGLIVATFVDFEISEIPDEISIGGFLAGLILSTLMPPVLGLTSIPAAFIWSLIGALVGGGSIYLMGAFGKFVFKKEAMGGGDVKLMAMIGSFLGWKLVLFTFFVAPLFGAVVGVILKMRYKCETIPYGPYLSLAALVAIFFGERILQVLLYGIY